MKQPHGNPQRLIATQAGISAAVVVIDQVTKAVADSQVCGSLVCPLRNRELVLGFGGKPSASVVVIALAGLAVFAVWASHLVRRLRIPLAPVVVVAASITSNGIDRVRFGAVRDFLVGPFNTVYNVADVAIFVGLLGCGIAALCSSRTRRSDDRHSIVLERR